jgi:hypothetical protein
MRTCSQCNTQSPDTVIVCPNCQADLRELSTTAVAIKKFRANPRVKSVRIVVSADACPACQQLRGDYDKNNIPELPVPGCSHEKGCRCFYAPALDEIYP